MADLGITGLKTEVDVQIYTNHAQAITGAIMNDTLIDTIDTLKNGGNLDLKSVDTAQLADGAVETLQINTGAVTEAKIASGAVTESKIGAKAVTSEKLADDVIQGGVYDVSSHNDDAVFESLSALLGSANLSTLIPTSVQHGGMSIRFIQGYAPNSDNKYIQYRLMSDTFNTTVTNWQGVDDTPKSGSKNVVESGGVEASLSEIREQVFDLDYTINALRVDETASAVSGTAFEKKYNVSIPSGTVIKFKISDGSMFQNGTAGFRINGTQVDVIITDEKSYTTQSIVSEISVVKDASSVIGTGSFDIIISAGSPLIDDVNALLEEKESISNKLSMWQPTPDNTHYPSEKLVKDTFAQIINTDNLTNSVTLYQENAVIREDGEFVTGVSDYNIYKLEVSSLQENSYLNCKINTTGNHLSLAYGYSLNDSPIEGYYYALSSGTYEFKIKPSEGVSYILFSKKNDTFEIIEASLGEGLSEFLSGGVNEHIINVTPTDTGENSLIGVLKRLMDDSSETKPSATNRYTVQLSAGTYDIDYTSLILSNSFGLFVMPYTTIKGKGRGITNLQFLYEGTDDDIMSKYSGLNMPYTSTLEDLSIIVENIRYTIHSDGNVIQGNSPHYTEITLRNVELIHLGINNGVTPSFDFPSAWGGGTFNGNKLRFENCRFYSKQCCPFSNHDRTGLVASPTFDFINCEFVSEADYNNHVSFATKEVGVLLNSWGSGVPIYCNFVNCFVQNTISLIVTTNQGNVDAKNDYQITIDNEQVVAIDAANNTNRDRHYITSGCRELYFASALEMGKPVKLTNIRGGAGYSSNSDVFYGICLHDVSVGGFGVVMHKGLIPTRNLLTGVFEVGKTYGWSNGAWVEDNANPLIKCITYSICEIL